MHFRAHKCTCTSTRIHKPAHLYTCACIHTWLHSHRRGVGCMLGSTVVKTNLQAGRQPRSSRSVQSAGSCVLLWVQWVPFLRAQYTNGNFPSYDPECKHVKTRSALLKSRFASDVQTMCKQCANNVQTMCKQCANNVQTMCKQCANNVQTMCKRCANNVQTICKQFANNVQTMYIQCTNSVQTMYKQGGEQPTRKMTS